MRKQPTQWVLTGVGVLVAVRFLSPILSPHAAQAEGVEKAPTVLRAQAIELVDASGQVRANLKVEAKGDVVLRMLDAKGTIRVKLGASEDGSGLVLLDNRTEPGVHLLTTHSGTKLTLAEKGKQKRIITP